MRVLALTFGNEHQASTKYRVLQYVEPLRQFGIEIEAIPANSFTDWAQVRSYDAVLVQKKLFRSGKVRYLRRNTPRLIYDIDDAIWYPHGKEHTFFTNLRNAWRLKAIARAADLCIAANNVIAEHLRNLTDRVTVLPLGLDGQRWQEKLNLDTSDVLRIGWAGHPVNLPYLEAIEPGLAQAQVDRPNLEFAIFCGKPPGFRSLKFRHIRFQPDAEVEAIRSFDIGILPLPPGPFAAGKSPIKGLQYMATGIPTVLTPLGATRDMFQEGETGLFANSAEEWHRAIARLARDPALCLQMGKRARAVFEERYELKSIVPILARLLAPDRKLPLSDPAALGTNPHSASR
jgi:glycosyltransferase involved in cell wall biosynthesis